MFTFWGTSYVSTREVSAKFVCSLQKASFFFKLDHAFLKKELVSIVVKEKHLRSDYRFGKVGTIHELICH